MSMSISGEVACTRCRFFDDHTREAARDDGICRFNPPVSQPSPDEHGLWPVVSGADWCGHFSLGSPALGTAD